MLNSYSLKNARITTSHKINIYDLIINLLILVLVLTVFAFNDQKLFLYPLKIVYIFTMGFMLILRNKYFNIHMWWSVLFILWCLASVLWAVNYDNVIFHFIWVLQAFLILMFTTPYLDSLKKLEFLLKCVIAGSLLLVVRLLYTTPLSYWGTIRVGFASGYNPNIVGIEMVVATLCAAYFIKKKRLRSLYILLSIIFVLVILLSGSRKSLIGLIIGLVIFLFFGTKKVKNIMITVPFLFILIYLMYYAVNYIPFFYNVIGDRLSDLLLTFQGQNDNIRINMVQIGLQLFSERPLFGYGIGSYEVISGFDAYSHNNYIEMLVNIGILGFIIYYSMYAYITFKLFIIWKHTKSNVPLLFFSIMIVLQFLEIGVVSYNTISLLLLIAASYSCIMIFNKSLKDEQSI